MPMNVTEAGLPSAPPLLLLHGAGCDHMMWAPQLTALSDRFRLLAPDFATGPEAFRFDRCSEQLGTTLADRGIGRVHVCGLSLGAMVGLHLAASRPDLVESLVLSGLQLRPPRVAMAVQRATMRALPPRALGATGPEEKGEVLALLRGLRGTDLTWCCQLVAAPTLVACGARDWPNRRSAQRAAAAIPGARLRIVPRAGHQWNQQLPREFTSMLAEFVAIPRDE